MATATSLPQEVRAYLDTCSPESANQIIETLRRSQVLNDPTAATANAPPIMTTVRAVKKQRSKKAKLARLGGGLKRPLNSFFAFRKYYSASLAPHTQKAISKVLRIWWGQELFTAKWAILAKAYSILRGSREKDEAPLDEFLEMAVPHIGIVAPQDYTKMMGWELQPPAKDDTEWLPQVVRTFVPDVSKFSLKYTATTLSADDLVTLCRDAGYPKSKTGIFNHRSPLNAQENLAMMVMPNATLAVNVPVPTTAPVFINESLGTISDASNGELLWDSHPQTLWPVSPAMSVVEPPPTRQTLHHAINTFVPDSNGSYDQYFDPSVPNFPAGNFDVTLNPHVGDVFDVSSDMFRGVDLDRDMTFEEMYCFDFSRYASDAAPE